MGTAGSLSSALSILTFLVTSRPHSKSQHRCMLGTSVAASTAKSRPSCSKNAISPRKLPGFLLAVVPPKYALPHSRLELNDFGDPISNTVLLWIFFFFPWCLVCCSSLLTEGQRSKVPGSCVFLHFFQADLICRQQQRLILSWTSHPIPLFILTGSSRAPNLHLLLDQATYCKSR